VDEKGQKEYLGRRAKDFSTREGVIVMRVKVGMRR
jgi:hypothetical protein